MRKTAFGLGRAGRLFNSPGKIGLWLTSMGGLGTLGTGAYVNRYSDKARSVIDENATSDVANGYKIPEHLKYSFNSRTNGVPAVYTDRDRAVADMKDAGLLNKNINEAMIDAMIKGDSPAYLPPPVHAAFLPDKYNGSRAMAHELGHAYDKDIKLSDRLLFLPRNFLPGFYNPDKSSLVRQETRAWDNAGVPAGDPMRESALDSYRATSRAYSYGAPATAALTVGGGILGGLATRNIVRLLGRMLRRR